MLAAGLLIGLVLGGPAGPARPARYVPLGGSVAAPADALSSSWYCAGATDDRGGAASGRLVLTNASGRSLEAHVSIVSDGAARRAEEVSVAPRAAVTVPETVAGGAPWVAAIVSLDGGSVTVEQETSGPLGPTAEPCATTVSASWYFAAGETLVNANSTISLLDPTAAPAIVDLAFTTDEGREQPGAFQGIVVPAGGLVEVSLRSQLRRRSTIATTVTATSGAVVAWKTDVVARPAKGAVILGTAAARAPLADPASPYVGVSEVAGAPAASTRWWWPEGITGRGRVEQYEVYNPGARTARVALTVALEQGSAEPFDLTVGPGQVATLATSTAARIPNGVAYGASLRSLDGVPVVAEQTATEAAPASGRGSTEVVGATTPARRWLVAVTSVGWDHEATLTVAGVSGRPASVRIYELERGRALPVPGLSVLHLDGRAPLVVDLARLSSRITGPLVVEASRRVVVARQLLGTGRTGGVTASLGVPLPG